MSEPRKKSKDRLDMAVLSAIPWRIPRLNAAGQLDPSMLPGGGGGGEANTASNQGTAGLGWFDGKVGVDLQFRNIVAGAGIALALDAPNKNITVSATGGGSSSSSTMPGRRGRDGSRGRRSPPMVQQSQAPSVAVLAPPRRGRGGSRGRPGASISGPTGPTAPPPPPIRGRTGGRGRDGRTILLPPLPVNPVLLRGPPGRGRSGPRGRPIPGAPGPASVGQQGPPGKRGTNGDSRRFKFLPQNVEDKIYVNAARTRDPDFQHTAPAAPAGSSNVRWQVSPIATAAGSQNRVSAYVLPAGKSTPGVSQFADDLEYSHGESIEADDIRITTSLFKKRHMQMVARFNSTTIDIVGMPAPTQTGTLQAILGTTYSVVRYLANSAGSWQSYHLDLNGIVRMGFDATCGWLIQTGSSHTNERMWIGFTDTDLLGGGLGGGVGAPTTQNVVGFRYDTVVDAATTNWRAVTCGGGGTATTTDTGVNAATTAGFRMIIQPTASDVTFWINDQIVAIHTTTLPGSGINLGHIAGVKCLGSPAVAADNRRIEFGRAFFFHTEFGL